MLTNDKVPNRLIHEKSPYLLEHAHNPVDWFSWSEEAFAKAKAEDKPVFLSVGYSTCHWCHVMAHESFEDEHVAELLNRAFISVKVDREERPDIDAVYMEVCQALTGSGGWPMTIIMTSDKKPFFAGTYFPKTSRSGRPGLTEILSAVTQRWREDRGALLRSGEEITAYLQSGPETSEAEQVPASELIARAVRQFKAAFDKTNGGFGSAPKFPMPHNLLFLLRYARLERDAQAQTLVEKTLVQMYRGGIFDHIGGGFSRYSTDERWLIPHFEKMLYDNAGLLCVYLEAYEQTGRPFYRRIAEKTFSYLLRELMSDAGAFYCAQDADSSGVEGKFYTFTPEEITAVLGEKAGKAFCGRFGIDKSGNMEGKSVPNLLGCETFETEDEGLSEQREKLFEYRLGRTSLHRDDKVLTAWNAMMLMALSRAAVILEDCTYLDAAKRTQTFIAERLYSGGRLMLRWKDGETAHEGQLDDYAFYGLALLELYAATLELSYLEEALRLAETLLARFEDAEDGGFFMYAEDAERLLTRPKPTYDGAMFSGNSAAAMLLVQLSRLSEMEKWQAASQRQLRFMSRIAAAQPSAHSFALTALMAETYASAWLVCVTAEEKAPPELMKLLRDYEPFHITVLLKTPGNARALQRISPMTESYPIPQTGAQYYLCRNGACLQPTPDIAAVRRALEGIFHPESLR